MLHPFFDPSRPVVIGHRGSAGTHPENTSVSFAAALDQGAQILESDIHVTRDGVPILLHDPELDRVSDGVGLAVDAPWSEIRALDAGARFQDKSGAYPFRGQGVGIPSLEDTFASFPEARFNLEVKCHDRAAIRATLDLIQRFDRADRTLLAAGEDDIMKLLRSELAEHPARPAVGACLGDIVASVSSALEDAPMPAGVMALQIPPDFAGHPLATPELVAHAHRHEVEIHVWTVNDLREIERLLELGVDGIVTDYPGQMAEWLSRRG